MQIHADCKRKKPKTSKPAEELSVFTTCTIMYFQKNSKGQMLTCFLMNMAEVIQKWSIVGIRMIRS